MSEIKTDMFPDHLRAGKKNGYGENKQKDGQRNTYKSAVTPTEPLPEASRPRKDGPGGE
ncbi:MAG: AE-binding protein [Eubacteriales bacterium]|nr:AE-binding protein [Eubacteriales bacterium]